MTIKTIRCCLCVDEATRKFFWEAMVEYTLLINYLFTEVAKHPQFQEWQLKEAVAQKPIKKLIEEFIADKPDYLPSRFETSAVRMTQYVYKSWFRLQKRRRLRLEGKKRWVEAIQRDRELAQTTSFSYEEICLKAQEILDSENHQGINTQRNSRSRKKLKSDSTLLGFLLDQFDATDNPLEQRAIIYLLKNDLAVSEQDKDAAILVQQLDSKVIEIERLEEQLQSQLPQGRDPTGEKYVQSLLSAIALPTLEEIDQVEATLSELKEQKQVKLFNSLPYPVIFGSADDLIWSVETKNATSKPEDSSIVQKPPITKKRKEKNSSDRLYVHFKGLKNFRFKIQCDRRQLPIFRQFLTDYQLHLEVPREKTFSQALFILRSAQLLWRPDTQQHHKLNLTEQSQFSQNQPWQTHRLYLHCNIDTRLLSAEGTETVRQQTKREILRELKGRETLSAEQLQELELTADQRLYVKRLQSTSARLDNPSPPRPSVNRYQGNPLIIVGVSLNPKTPLTACAIDLQTGNTLAYQNAKQLLTLKKIKAKPGKRSLLQLKLADWRLVNKLHFRRQRNLLNRSKDYQQGRYRESAYQANQGLHVERLLASKLVCFAMKWQAGSIAVPDLKNIREILESEIQAKARRKYPAQKKLQEQYAKQFRTMNHRWSYSRLVQCIRDRATKEGITVITGQQPSQGEPRQQARQVATSAYAA